MLNKENVLRTFEDYNSRSADYPGALFYKLFDKIPNSYELYLDKDNNVKFFESQDNEKDKEVHDTNIKINTNKLISNIIKLSKENKYLDVFAASADEYIILYSEPDYEFLSILQIGGPSASGDLYEAIFTENEKGIENAINVLKSCIIKYKRGDEIVEFGITAVDCGGNLYTSYYEYEHKEIDIKTNYNDDLPYNKICSLIENDGSSELLLFYGDPGTGKTSLIKHLINKYPKKDFIFIDGSFLANVQQTALISYFLENDNTVFILEDCEKILASRDEILNPVMPVLLNITDGIIGDVLGIKLICTFNTKLSNIDKALLRKGRLSLKYEFKALNIEKAKKLAGDMKDKITKDTTLADIYYIKEENDFSKKKEKKIGF